MPPDFALRPPATATGQSGGALRQIARQAMLGRPHRLLRPRQRTDRPVQALLDRTGAAESPVGHQGSGQSGNNHIGEADQSFVERLMFWSNTPEAASVVDARRESGRIQENQALNKPVTEGQTPTIRRKPEALLEGIF